VIRRSLMNTLYATAYIVATLCVWFFLTRVLKVRRFILPDPTEVLASYWSLPYFYAENFAVTFLEAAIGAVLGFSLGMLLGITLRYGGAFGRALSPLVIASQVFPKEALAPIIIIVLGFGLMPKVVISAVMCFFPVAISTYPGLRDTPVSYDRLLDVLGAGPLGHFRHAQLPYAVPHLMSATKVCMTLSVIGAVIGEFLGSSHGLGYIIRSAASDLGMDRVYAALLLLAVLGALFYGFAVWIERRLLQKYMHRQR
jgi:NitT/TauT family transport system permease protein